ncbi:MAG: sialate O-acetylesterase [Cyanobacteria bacterium J06634_5]
MSPGRYCHIKTLVTASLATASITVLQWVFLQWLLSPLAAIAQQPILPARSFHNVFRAKPSFLPPKANPLPGGSFRTAHRATTSNPASVYLMAGQSNLVGEALVKNLPPQYGLTFPSVQIWGVSASPEDRRHTAFVDLAPGFDGYYESLGPELSFGRRLVALNQESVYLIKDGLGATNLAEDWNPSGLNNAYDNFTQTVDAALNELNEQGIAYEIKGLVWMQGESDVWIPSAAAAYEENLRALVDAVRSRYGTSLPIAIGLIRADLPTDDTRPLNQVRLAQRSVAAADSRIVLIETDTLGKSTDLLQSDDVHYNATGQVSLGTAFAEALQSILEN